MSRKWFSIVALIAIATFFLSLSGCGFNQHLVSINIPSSSGTFGAADPGLFFDFKAFGTYVHPPQTKDITNLVTWQSDNPQVVQVSSMGVVSPNLGCGVADIYATFKDGSNLVVSNSVPVTVDGPAASGCTPPGLQPILTISFAGNGTGTVTGPGVSCSSPSSCSNQFTTGTTITLTASPTGGSSFASWSGCSSTSGTNGSVCTVLLQNNLTVTATFN
jgi:Divergent InlB B-repeat domain